jgi:hypothetical protein
MPPLALRGSHLHEAAAGDVEICEVVLREGEGHGIRRAACGAGHHHGAELFLDLLFGKGATVEDGVPNHPPLALECGFIRDEHEVALLLARHGEVALAGEGHFAPVIEAVEVFGVDVVLGKEPTVMSAEGDDTLFEIRAEAVELPVVPDFRRRGIPLWRSGEKFHGWV